MSEQLIIAGFHRSGTSLTAQLLERAGLFLGYELLGARASNPYGHFEDREVVMLQEGILADNELTWAVGEPFVPVVSEERWGEMRRIVERRNAEHALWGFKDPRVCMFIMLWKYLLPDAKVLLVYRHFADSTYSLLRRHSTDLLRNEGRRSLHRMFWEEPDLTLKMWLVHNKALLAFARVYPEDTLVVSSQMIQDGFPLVRVLNERWGFNLADIPVGEVFDPGATAGRPGRQPVADRRLLESVDAVWRELETLAAQTETKMMEEAGLAEG